MTRDTVDAVIREFGTAYDAPDMTLDDDDFVCFTTPDGVVINADYFNEGDYLVVYTTIGEIFDNTRLEIYGELLRANFFWELTAGTTLSIDPEGDHALLTAGVSAADLDVPKLANLFEHINQLTMGWAGRIRAITAARLAEEADTAKPGAGPDPARFA